MREAAERAGGGWIYDRRCLSLTPEQIAEYEATGVARAIRFRVPPGEMRFHDLVHGRRAMTAGSRSQNAVS